MNQRLDSTQLDPAEPRRRRWAYPIGKRARLIATVGLVAALGAGALTLSSAPAASADTPPPCTPPLCIPLQTLPSQQTKVTLSLSAGDVALPGAVTATATVSYFALNTETGLKWLPESGGTVQFSDSLTGAVGSAPVVAGTATLRLSGLAVGTNAISASYSGQPDGPFYDVPSTSGTATVTGDVSDATWSLALRGAPSVTQLLEVNGNSPADGAAVDTWQTTIAGGSVQSNELWRYAPTIGTGPYGQIVSASSGKCLEVNGATGAVDQWSCVSGAANELWNIATDASGVTQLTVKSSGSHLGSATPVSQAGNGTQLSMQDSPSTTTAWALVAQG